MKIIKILLSLICIIGVCKLGMSAFSDYNIKLQNSKENIGKNEEIFVDMYVDTKLNDSIKSIECTIDYDTNIFKDISKSDIKLYNIDKNVEFDKERLTIKINNIKSEKILRIRLISKTNIESTNTKIQFKNIRLVTNEGYKSIGDISSNISIKNINSSSRIKHNLKNNELIGNLESNILEKDKQIINQLDEFMSFESIKNIDIGSIFLNPFKLFGIFLKAIIIVVIINALARFICKISFSYADILQRRMQSRKLTKVLNDLYK